jgi:hypothetical protein
MITNKKNIFKTYIEPLAGGLTPSDDPDDYPLIGARISSNSSSTSAVCAFVLDTSIYINVLTPEVINTGDYIFLTDALTFPFQGNNQYYLISLLDPEGSYYVRVDNNGLINEVGLCL